MELNNTQMVITGRVLVNIIYSLMQKGKYEFSKEDLVSIIDQIFEQAKGDYEQH